MSDIQKGSPMNYIKILNWIFLFLIIYLCLQFGLNFMHGNLFKCLFGVFKIFLCAVVYFKIDDIILFFKKFFNI